MKSLLLLLALAGVATAYDCFGRSGNCTGAPFKCNSGYEPFCEHIMEPGRPNPLGVCSCDKDCKAASDCTNPTAEGCPDGHGFCDMTLKICHCGRKPPTERQGFKHHH